MSQRTIPISVRIGTEDAEFIAGLELEGATTPSDKVRALLADARRRAQGAGDYGESLRQAQDSLAPARRAILGQEHQHGLHSALLARTLEWLPETVAFLLANANTAEQATAASMKHLERGVMERVARLMESVLQLALAPDNAAYAPDMVRERLAPVLQLARLNDLARKQQGEVS